MTHLLKILGNRNFILVLAVVAGLFAGELALFFEPWMLLILAIVMTFSTTGISTKMLTTPRKIYKPFFAGIILNYVLYGAVILLLSHWLIDDISIFYGMVVIAATPPGVAIIPFSAILKGDINYSIMGTLGAFLASIGLAPLIVSWFAGSGGINPMDLFYLMIKLILIPLVLSRFLLMKPVVKYVLQGRGKIVDWGFAIIIYTAVGLNREVFFEMPASLLSSSLVLFISIFVLGYLYEYIVVKITGNKVLAISQSLLVTIKSSGFAAVTALSLFGTRAAIPAAALAIFVLGYLLSLSFRVAWQKKRNIEKNENIGRKAGK